MVENPGIKKSQWRRIKNRENFVNEYHDAQKPYVNQNSNDRPFGYAMLSPCPGLYKRFTDHITFTFSLDFINKALDYKHGVVLPDASRPTRYNILIRLQQFDFPFCIRLALKNLAALQI